MRLRRTAAGLLLVLPACDLILDIGEVERIEGAESIPCLVDAECDDDNACTEDQCNGQTGHCAITPLGDTAAPEAAQTDGDCKRLDCVAGKPVKNADDGDPPDDRLDCTDDVCEDGEPSNPLRSAGTRCDGGYCDGEGACLECVEPSHCRSGLCNDGVCEAGLWSRSLGDVGYDWGEAIAVDADGNVFTSGRFTDAIDFGQGSVAALGMNDIYLLKLDPLGNVIWATTVGGTENEYLSRVVVDPEGNVILAAVFAGTVTLGSSLTSLGGDDLLVAKLDTFGNVTWSRAFGGAGNNEIDALAVDGAGNVVLSGAFDGTLSFGNTTLVAVGQLDGFVAKLSGAGNPLWARAFGGDSDDRCAGVASDGSDDVWLAGVVVGMVDLGCGSQTGGGAGDLLIARLAGEDGECLWSSVVGDASEQMAQALTLAEDGGPIVAGATAGSIDFGGGNVLAASGLSLFAVQLAANGAHVWSRAFGPPLAVETGAIARLADGSVVATGYFFGSLAFGTLPALESEGAMFMVHLADDGEPLWSQAFGGGQYPKGTALAVAGVDRLALAGVFQGSIDLGLGTLGATNYDAFIARIAVP